MTYKYLLPCLLLVIVIISGDKSPPHIVLIVADDLGWDDVSFHGSDQILTPNIDLLAYSGAALGRYYSHCVCTPSRAALLTGKYGYTLGMQGYPLTYGEDRALPATDKILPQYLKEKGYSTHLVGKWHLGHARKEYLPTMRGFDTHFGHRGGYIDYYEYVTQENWSTGSVAGLDMYRNLTPDWTSEGYVTDLYSREAINLIKAHEPTTPMFLMVSHLAPHSGNDHALLQAPHALIRDMRHVDTPERRVYAAMVKKLDDSVGDIITALSHKGILQDTIVAFISDNGGMTSGNSVNYASNFPLRGLKMSPFEGGVRVVGAIWSPLLNKRNFLYNGMMHVTDWVPTLLSAVGLEPPSGLDGVSLWESINSDAASPRNEVFEIDDYTGFASATIGDYKLVTGNVTIAYSNHQGGDLRGIIGKGPSYAEALTRSQMYAVLSNSGKTFDMDVGLRDAVRVYCRDEGVELCYPQDGAPCLFNLKEDPCEYRDVSAKHPDIVARLQARLATERRRTVPRAVPLFRDPRARPSLHNYTWTTWADGL